MAYAIPMIQPMTRKRAIGYTGISWTCLFFGPIPALYRRHTLGFIGMTLVNFATFGLSAPVFIFVYNAWHYHSLVSRGFQPVGHSYGNVSHSFGEMSAENCNDLEDPYAVGADRSMRRFAIASPIRSEKLIDDPGQ